MLDEPKKECTRSQDSEGLLVELLRAGFKCTLFYGYDSTNKRANIHCKETICLCAINFPLFTSTIILIMFNYFLRILIPTRYVKHRHDYFVNVSLMNLFRKILRQVSKKDKFRIIFLT